MAPMVTTGELLRNGVGATAAGLAAFATGFIAYMWLTLDTGPATAERRGEARDLSGSSEIHPKLVDPGTATAGSETRNNDGVRLASIRVDASEFALTESDHWSEAPLARSSFGERFSSDQSSHPFDGRFFGEVPASRAPVRSAAAAAPAILPRNATAAPSPRPAAGSRGAQVASKSSAPRFQLASVSDTSVALAYAPNHSLKDSGPALKDLKPKDSDPLADIDTSRTAIYDITSSTVYMPNGRRLEAHSGLGSQMDDPRHVSAKDTGPTPPNVYELKLRESPFHGVRAIRLIPTDSSKMYGRDGILAHSYLLGPSGQSNGCVSFSDYGAFLDAFLRGDVDRLVVVERFADAPFPTIASDWLVNKLKDIFRRS
jgi:hypothetical protein